MPKFTNRRGVAAILSAAIGTIVTTTAVRADSGYGYAEQTLSALKVSTTVAGSSLSGSITSASAVVNGTGIATNNPTDTLQAYQLTGPAAPQNTYTKYSTQGGGTQAGDFARGDALLTGGANLFTSGITVSTVSETSTSAANGLLTGTSNWQIAGTFSSSAASISITYNFANEILSQAVGTNQAPATAQFGFLATLKDQHGHEVDASPAELNTTLSAPINGPELITSGSGSVVLSLAGLTAGDTYTLTLGGQTLAAAGTSVPEPAMLGMLGFAGLTMRRRR